MKKIFKNILALGLLMTSVIAYSQVVIGGKTGSAGSNVTSVLLDFPTGQNKGLIVPYVRTLPASAVEGTIVLDATASVASRVKYFNGSWVDLSGQDANVTTVLLSQPLAITEGTSKAIIGAPSSTADGVLVLESTTKAMVLPIVTDVNDILSPSPGMMVYVKKAGSKRLAVYNGSKWSFWKP